MRALWNYNFTFGSDLLLDNGTRYQIPGGTIDEILDSIATIVDTRKDISEIVTVNAAAAGLEVALNDKLIKVYDYQKPVHIRLMSV